MREKIVFPLLDVGIKLERLVKSVWAYFAAFVTYSLSYYSVLFKDHWEQVNIIIMIFGFDILFGAIAGMKNDKEGFKTNKFLVGWMALVIWLILYFSLVAIEKGFQTPNLAKTIMGVVLIATIISTAKNIIRIGWIKNKKILDIFDLIDSHKSDSFLEKMREKLYKKDSNKETKNDDTGLENNE